MCFGICLHESVYYVCLVPRSPEVQGSYNKWLLRLGPELLEEQPVLLAVKPSLQPLLLSLLTMDLDFTERF